MSARFDDDWLDDFSPEELEGIAQGIADVHAHRTFHLKWFLGHVWAIRNKDWPKDGLERPAKISLTGGPLFNLLRKLNNLTKRK